MVPGVCGTGKLCMLCCAYLLRTSLCTCFARDQFWCLDDLFLHFHVIDKWGRLPIDAVYFSGPRWHLAASARGGPEKRPGSWEVSAAARAQCGSRSARNTVRGLYATTHSNGIEEHIMISTAEEATHQSYYWQHATGIQTKTDVLKPLYRRITHWHVSMMPRSCAISMQVDPWLCMGIWRPNLPDVRLRRNIFKKPLSTTSKGNPDRARKLCTICSVRMLAVRA